MVTDVPLSAELRERTKEHHVRAERHPLQQQVARGQIGRGTWGRLVAQNRVLHEALERTLDGAAGREPRLARVFAPHHRRLEKFDADLRALNVIPGDRAALPATRDVAAWIESLGRDEPLSLLGVLYVVEGATNGGQFLSRALGPALGVAPGSAGILSLDPHGAATRELWGQFRTNIDALGLARAERDRVIAAAGETFDALTRIFDAVELARGATDGAAAVTQV